MVLKTIHGSIMLGVTQRSLLPPLKYKAKAFSSTSSANNLLGLKSCYKLRDNFFQKDLFAINDKVEPMIVSKNWLLNNKPYPCAQTPCARVVPAQRSFLAFGFGAPASLRTTCLMGETRALHALASLPASLLASPKQHESLLLGYLFKNLSFY